VCGRQAIGIRLLNRNAASARGSGFPASFFGLCFCAAFLISATVATPPGNAQTLFPVISYGPYRNSEGRGWAGVRPSAPGFFFGFWFCAAQEKGREMKAAL